MLTAVLVEAGFYAVFAGIAFALLFALIAVALLPTLRGGGRRYLGRLRRIAFFLLLVFLWGSLASSVWWFVLAPRWYVRADPLVEYVPILPFGDWAIDQVCGGYLLPGVTLRGLQVRWLLMTLAVWGLSGWTDVRLRQWRGRRQGRLSGAGAAAL